MLRSLSVPWFCSSWDSANRSWFSQTTADDIIFWFSVTNNLVGCVQCDAAERVLVWTRRSSTASICEQAHYCAYEHSHRIDIMFKRENHAFKAGLWQLTILCKCLFKCEMVQSGGSFRLLFDHEPWSCFNTISGPLMENSWLSGLVELSKYLQRMLADFACPCTSTCLYGGTCICTVTPHPLLCAISTKLIGMLRSAKSAISKMTGSRVRYRTVSIFWVHVVAGWYSWYLLFFYISMLSDGMMNGVGARFAKKKICWIGCLQSEWSR